MFQAFSAVWLDLLDFFVSLFASIGEIFYTVGEGGAVSLTFVGTCAIIMAGVALILLAFNIIRSFLPMRG